MDTPDQKAPVRRARKAGGVRGRVRAWMPRLLPRDKFDVRLLVAVYAVLIPLVFGVMWLLTALPALLARMMGVPPLLVIAMTPLLALVMLWGALRALISRVETADDGLRVVGVRSRTVGWDEIEAVDPLNRWETVRAMLHWPFWEWNLQMSGGMTFGGYVRIKTKQGTLIFGPQDRAAFLEELHTHLYRAKAPVQIPIWQWHTVTPQTSETDVQSVQQIKRD